MCGYYNWLRHNDGWLRHDDGLHELHMTFFWYTIVAFVFFEQFVESIEVLFSYLLYSFWWGVGIFLDVDWSSHCVIKSDNFSPIVP